MTYRLGMLRPRLRTVVVFFISAIAGLLIGFVTIPFSAFYLAPVGYWPAKELFRETSPDGRYLLRGSVAVDFPPNEWLDPKGTLRLELTDESGARLDVFWVGSHEADDFKRPTITWQSDGKVLVRDMEETGHELSAILDIHRRSRPR